jgi:hypothetical protein
VQGKVGRGLRVVCTCSFDYLVVAGGGAGGGPKTGGGGGAGGYRTSFPGGTKITLADRNLSNNSWRRN